MRTPALVLGILAATCLAASADEAALKASIVGTWKHEHRQIGVQADTVKKYGADGSYSATSKIRMLGKNSTVDYEGKWEILPGPVLRLKVTKTSNRLFVPMGEVYNMKSFKIEEDIMTYTHDGKTNREVRQKAPED